MFEIKYHPTVSSDLIKVEVWAEEGKRCTGKVEAYITRSINNITRFQPPKVLIQGVGGMYLDMVEAHKSCIEHAVFWIQTKWSEIPEDRREAPRV